MVPGAHVWHEGNQGGVEGCQSHREEGLELRVWLPWGCAVLTPKH